MASIIRIKRSSTAGNPATLGAGELAYSALTDNGSNGGDRLYIGIGAETSGNAANHFVVGGKYFTDMMDHNRGTLTASSAILVDSNSKIDNLKVDNLDLNGNTISSTDTDGNIVLDPNGTGYVSISGTNGLVIPVGNNAQQGPSVQGAIRYNTDTSSFEGYSGSTWGSLGGVKSVDGLTFISAESSPGASNDTLSFVTDGVERLFIDTDSAEFDATVVVRIDSTTASTSTTTGALVVSGGVGIAGALYVGGAISAESASFASINNTPIGNTTPSTGAFTTLTANNAVTFTANTGSTSTSTGTVVVTGGVGVSQNVFIGGTLGVTGETTLASATISDLTANRVVLAGTSGSIQDSANLTFDGTTLAVTGAVTISSTLGVTGDTTLTGNLTVNGNTTIGDTNTDTVTVNADVASSLIPSTDNAYDLGAVGSEWRDLFITGTANIDSLVADTADINGGSIDGVTIGTNSVVTDLRVDNIRVDSNTISATNENGNITLAPDGTGTVDVSGKRITSVAEPTQAQDAATKAYVDSLSNGLDVKASVKASTTTALTATYDNGTSGVGATLTNADTQAALTLDSIALQVGDRVLIKDQTSALQNGVYTVTTVGTISTNWVLTRATDFDNSPGTEVSPGTFFFVEQGTSNADNGYVISTNEEIIIGTTDIVFSQFSGAGQITAGDGLTKTGNTINAVGTADRISITADAIDIASTYVGQTSITTLGTIGTGTWQGTVIAPTYGGTGVNNGNSTITLGGSFTHTGAHTLGLTTTGNTSVTLPTTGTLATLSGTESLSNKTITSSSFSGTTIAASGLITFTDATDATSLTTAAVILSGGLAVTKQIRVGTNITGAGADISNLSGFNIDGGTY
jgi:hypothetical protein